MPSSTITKRELREQRRAERQAAEAAEAAHNRRRRRLFQLGAAAGLALVAVVVLSPSGDAVRPPRPSGTGAWDCRRLLTLGDVGGGRLPLPSPSRVPRHR